MKVIYVNHVSKKGIDFKDFLLLLNLKKKKIKTEEKIVCTFLKELTKKTRC